MTSPRLVLVSRRFWPLVGGAESATAQLAAAFHERGCPTTILTARWSPDWPPEIEHRGVRVVRLAQSTRRWWGTWQYMRALGTWFQSHQDTFDLVYVSMLKHDAYAALGAARGRWPVVLRAEGAGLTGDAHWQLEAPCGARIKRRCAQAQALVAPSPAIHSELVAAGFPRQRLHYVPNGVRLPPARSDASKSAARAALAHVLPGVVLAPGAPLVVYTGRLDEAKGLGDLIEAWPAVMARHPRARLWLVGEGPWRADLLRRIQAADLEHCVALTGAFDTVDEVLAAADLFVLPSWVEGLSLSLLEAMAGGLPIVASDIPGNRTAVTHDVEGWLVPARAPLGWAAAISGLLADSALARRLGTAARERVARAFSLAKTADDHLELFQRLLSGP